MTENKRFKLTYVCGDFGLIDNDEWIDLHSMSENSEKNVQICINKMNELADENEQLEKENKELKDKNSQLQETLAFRSNQLALMERLVDDLGSEEMARQMGEILND